MSIRALEYGGARLCLTFVAVSHSLTVDGWALALGCMRRNLDGLVPFRHLARWSHPTFMLDCPGTR